MNFNHLHTIIAIITVCFLTSCHSDIDLDDIDKKAEVEMGLVLPIGNLHMKVGDFLGADKIDHLFVEDGVFVLKLDTAFPRNYSKFELKDYLPDVNMPPLDVYSYLPTPDMGGYKVIPGGPSGYSFPIPFPLTLKMNGINDPDSIGKQRLDRALIDSASFVSTISIHNGMTLDWDYIERIELDLGDRIIPEDGTHTMLVYEKNNPEFAQYTDFGQAIDTRLRDFAIDLMINQHPGSWAEYLTNVVEEVTFYVIFTVNVPAETNIIVPMGSGFDYHMTVQFLDYKAIWGMFEPSNEMHDENTFDIAGSWDDLDFLTRASLPFANPKVDIDITTRIAGALRIRDAYVYTINSEGVRADAAFGPEETKTKTINFEAGEYLSLDSELGDSTTNMWVHFNNTPEGGRIHRLFRGIPKQLGYCFNVEFNAQTTPQIRVVPDMRVNVKTHTTLPLAFDEGMHLDYTDSIMEVNLSQYSIQSLTRNNDIIDTVKTTDLTLFVTAHNTIPMDVQAVFRCLNADGDTIMDPLDETKPLSLFEEDSLTFVAPHYELINGHWQMTEEGKTVITAKMTKEKLNLLPDIDRIVYTAIVENKTLKDEYDVTQGEKHFTAEIGEDSGITLKIGLTAHADVIFNLGK